MSKSLKDKLNKLENNVLQKPEVGTTKICTCAFPEPEQVLLEKARQLALMELPFEEATKQQLTILEKAQQTLNFRVFDLFTSYLEGLLCRDDKIARVILHERFLWFIQQLREEIRQNLEVSELERNALEDSEVDVVDEYFRKSKPVFTEESYDKLSTEIALEMFKAKKNVKKKRKQSDKEG